MKHCKCKKSTSSVNSKCIECGGNMTLKWKKAQKYFMEYVKKELKKKCDLCGGKLDHIMYDCKSFIYCLNKKCSRNDIGEKQQDLTPSYSITS